MLDADLERFRELRATRHGLRLALAIHEGNIALKQIQRQTVLGGPKAELAIETWQRAYVRACNSASEAIDVLWDRYRWPADAGRDRGYCYRPPPTTKPNLYRPYLGPK